MNQQLQDFLRELKHLIKPVNFSPRIEQLQQLADAVAVKKPQTINELNVLFCEVFPNTLVISNEGIDNSDLRTILALAIAATQKK